MKFLEHPLQKALYTISSFAVGSALLGAVACTQPEPTPTPTATPTIARPATPTSVIPIQRPTPQNAIEQPALLDIQLITAGNSAAWSPDEKSLAVYREDSESLFLVDLNTSQEELIYKFRHIDGAPWNFHRGYYCPAVDIVWIDNQTVLLNRNANELGILIEVSINNKSANILYEESESGDSGPARICGLSINPDKDTIVYGAIGDYGYDTPDVIKIGDVYGMRNSLVIYTGFSGLPRFSAGGDDEVYFVRNKSFIDYETVWVHKIKPDGLNPVKTELFMVPQVKENLSMSISSRNELAVGYDNLIVMQFLDGSDITQLRMPVERVYNLKYSPSGNEILFSTNHKGPASIYIVKVREK